MVTAAAKGKTVDCSNHRNRECLKLAEHVVAFFAKRLALRFCQGIGLVNNVYPLEELIPAAKKLASTIAANAPIAVRNCKKAINDGLLSF